MATLALFLLAIASVSFLALSADLDLLGIALLAIYSSVFIFLYLIALYFTNTPAPLMPPMAFFP
jgi:hypothetical protein